MRNGRSFIPMGGLGIGGLGPLPGGNFGRFPVFADLLQWIAQYPDSVEGEPNFNDKADEGLSKAVAVGMPCVELNKVDQYGHAPVSGSIDVGTKISGWIIAPSQDPAIIVSYGAGFTGGKRFTIEITGDDLKLTIDDNVSITDLITTLTVVDNSPHYFEAWIDALNFNARVDGGTIQTGAHSKSLPITPNGFLTIGAVAGISLDTPGFFTGGCIFGVEVSGFGEYPLCENSGLTSYDVSGNDNDIAWNVGSGDIATMRSGKQNLVNYCGENGFYVAVQGTAPFIPALNDGSGLAANGQPLTNLGGYVHNNGPFNVLQTDATLLGTPSFWSADGITFDEKSYADFLAFISGNFNLWLKWLSINGVCHLSESAQYDYLKTFTLAEYTQMLAWLGGAACGGGVVPFEFNNLDFSNSNNSHWLGVL